MKKRLTLQASGNSYFHGYKCSHCGSAMVIASNAQSPNCAFCSEPLDKGTPVSRAELTASPEKELSYIKCVSCDTVFTVGDTSETAEELAASKYCVDCAGDTLVPCDSNGAVLEAAEDEKLCGSEDDTDDDIDPDGSDIIPESVMSEDDYTEMDASSHDDLQWNALDTTEGEMTAMLASSTKTGNPVAIFRKDNAPASMQPLFAQSLFISAFNEVAGNEGLATAIKVFGGNYFSPKVLTATDIEKAAMANMKATTIPRLVDCCQMAVEGGVKGIYPDVYSSLQRSLVNELVASGIESERATTAVNNTFAIHGSDLFGTIVAKAMELFNKPEAARVEAKALIMQASSAVSSLQDSKQAELKAAMERATPNFGVINMTAAASTGPDLTRMRRELF